MYSAQSNAPWFVPSSSAEPVGATMAPPSSVPLPQSAGHRSSSGAGNWQWARPESASASTDSRALPPPSQQSIQAGGSLGAPSARWTDTGWDDLHAGSSGHLDLSSHSSASTAPAEASGSHRDLVPSGSVSSLTTIPSSLSDWPVLERETLSAAEEPVPPEQPWSFWGRLEHQGSGSSAASSRTTPSTEGRLSHRSHSESESRALVPSTPSGSSSDLAAAPSGGTSAVDAAYAATKHHVGYDLDSYGPFREAYNGLKDTMSRTGSVQTGRLGDLLNDEEEVIRSTYGRTAWDLMFKELDINPGWDAAKRSARNSQLKWIKEERTRLHSQAALAPIREEESAAESLAAPDNAAAAVTGTTRPRASKVSRLSRWASTYLAPKSIGRSRLGR